MRWGLKAMTRPHSVRREKTVRAFTPLPESFDKRLFAYALAAGAGLLTSAQPAEAGIAG
mgnify:CR=1 FL=1